MGVVTEKTYSLKYHVRGESRIQYTMIRANTAGQARNRLHRDSNVTSIVECKEI